MIPTCIYQHATEGRVWEAWNSDGRVNLGSWLASKERATFTAACDLLDAHPDSTSAETYVDDAWTLTGCLLWLADTVQSATSGARPNRENASHKEAARWCEVVYGTLAGSPVADPAGDLAFPSTGVRDMPALRAWAARVEPVATGLYRKAAQRIEQNLTGGDRAKGQGHPGTPAPAEPEVPSPVTGPVTQQPGMMAGWEGLLAAIGQSEHPERMTHLLAETCGAPVLSQIDAATFGPLLAAWQADPSAFSNAARAAWQRAMTAGAPS